MVCRWLYCVSVRVGVWKEKENLLEFLMLDSPVMRASIAVAAFQVPRLSGEISMTSDMQMTPPLWQKVKRN